MDERNTGTGRDHRTVIYILCLLSVCSVIFLCRAVSVGRTLDAELSEETARIAVLESAAETLMTRLGQTEREITLTGSLPQEIERMRDRFFDEARLLESMVQEGKTGVKIAYLTFDDGPYDLTWQYLDVLREYGVLATFFQRGRDWDRFGDIYLAVRDGCHTMGNHTYSHKIRNGIYRSADVFMEDLLSNRQYLKEKTGVTSEVMRFPGGSSTAGKLKDSIIERLRSEHYAYVDWNGATGDGLYEASANEYRDNVLKGTDGRKFLVVLMHDYNRDTLAALPEIIEGLREQGYVFLPLFYDSLAVNR